ncbi:MAG: sugar kinase [Acidobacteria bacterium]|nr:sugar kinase [Acidobacteriota bacterium]
MDSAQLLSLTDAFRGKRVVVFGDLVADEFVYGRVARVSREAPVLILEYDSTEIVPGGAGNAANNVAALGGGVALVAVVGRDEPGRRVVAALHRRVDPHVVRTNGAPTSIKTRILAGGVHSAKQQVVRIDRAVPRGIDPKTRKAVERAALAAVRRADAVLVSDYGSGLITPRLVRTLTAELRRAGRSVPVLIDTRYRLLDYTGLTISTPNQSEVEQALSVRIGDNLRLLERAGREILERTRMQAVLVTRGSHGMSLFLPEARTVHIPIFGTEYIVDVTGAGDTVVSTVALALAAGGSFEGAARLANYAGGLVVMKRGTATVSSDELRAAIRANSPRPSAPARGGAKAGG